MRRIAGPLRANNVSGMSDDPLGAAMNATCKQAAEAQAEEAILAALDEGLARGAAHHHEEGHEDALVPAGTTPTRPAEQETGPGRGPD